MCLQWCHATHQLIDNDLPCDHCAPFAALQPDQRCESCCHRVDRDGKAPMCRLTRMGLPLAGGCCHANVTLFEPEGGVIWLGADDVAPGLMQRRRVDTVAALFDRSTSAPEYARGGGDRIQVALRDLALPEVYGVPSPNWDEALGRERPQFVWTEAAEAIVRGPRYGDQVVPLIEAIGQEMESGTLTPWRRAELLAAARALLPLPVPWDEIITEAIKILEEPSP